MLDAALIEAFRRREDAGVRSVYREYGRLVYAIALRALGNKELAEDATQQTFVQAWQAADRFESDRELAPWLATIARRTARRSTLDAAWGTLAGLLLYIFDAKQLSRQLRKGRREKRNHDLVMPHQ